MDYMTNVYSDHTETQIDSHLCHEVKIYGLQRSLDSSEVWTAAKSGQQRSLDSSEVWTAAKSGQQRSLDSSEVWTAAKLEELDCTNLFIVTGMYTERNLPMHVKGYFKLKSQIRINT